MSISAKNLWRLLGASAAIMFAAAALNFAVDPLQLFRSAKLLPPMYSNDVRMQNAGLIRSQEFDTIFMGTSLSIHFRQSDIDRALGVRSLKLTMQGSSSHEQVFVLEETLKQRRPKRVVWQMDDWIFVDAPEVETDIYLSTGLYRRDWKGVAGYLFSGVMARESALLLLRAIPVLAPVADQFAKFTIPDVDDINTLARDADVAAQYNARAAMAAFVRISNPSRVRFLGEGYGYESEVRNFERDAVRLIAQHPDVQFDIYFPPYSILQFVAMRDASPATLKIVTDLTEHIAKRLVQFPNVRLSDFRAIKGITHDLDNYSDVIHHSPEIDLKVLEMLAKDEHRVGSAAPTASLQELKVQIETYKVERH
jgi:hypothetical protein